MHCVALIVLYDDRQDVLLQHRTDDAHLFPGHWAFFGGSCESDETPLEAVIRETEEELCYRLTSPRLVMEQPFSVNGLECLMYLYVEQHHGDKSMLRLCEGQGWGWFGAGETEKLLMTEHDRSALRVARNFISGQTQ